MKKVVLTLIAALVMLLPLVWMMYKGMNMLVFLLCAGLGALILLYAYSVRNVVFHQFMEWILVGVMTYFLVILPLRLWSAPLSCAAEFLVAFALAYLFSAKGKKRGMKPYIAFCAVTLPLLLLELPVRISDFDNSLISLPGFVLYLLGVVCGWIVFHRNRRVTWGLASVMALLALFYGCKGYEYWHNKLAYGTFTGRVEQTAMKDYRFLDEKGDTIRLSQWRGRKVLIDCWTKWCGICREKMPIVQRLHERYESGDEVYVASLFIAYRDDKKEDGSQIAKEEGYSFPVWSIDRTHELISDLNITSYPRVLVFDEEGCLIFHGSIEEAEKLLNNE